MARKKRITRKHYAARAHRDYRRTGKRSVWYNSGEAYFVGDRKVTLPGMQLEDLRRGLQQCSWAVRAAAEYDILAAAGDVLKEKLIQSFYDSGLNDDTGQLLNSIEIDIKYGYVDVGPRNERNRRYNIRRQRKGRDIDYGRYFSGGYGAGKFGKRDKVRNAEVGFIHEFGTSRHRARHWISKAAQQSAFDVSTRVAEILGEITLEAFEQTSLF